MTKKRSKRQLWYQGMIRSNARFDTMTLCIMYSLNKKISVSGVHRASHAWYAQHASWMYCSRSGRNSRVTGRVYGGNE